MMIQMLLINQKRISKVVKNEEMLFILVAQFIGLFPDQVIHDVIIINIDIFNVIFLFELIVCDEQGLG